MRRMPALALVIAAISGLLLASQSLGVAPAGPHDAVAFGRPAAAGPGGVVWQQPQQQERGATADAEAPVPADLRLEWLLEDGVATEVPSIQGTPGEVVELAYRLRNVGGREAFAVVVRADTALGPVGAPERLEPGPEAGKSFPRFLALPLAQGMREVCLQAQLQNRRAEDPPDPNPEDNRICRRVMVEEGASVPAVPAPTAYLPPWVAWLIGGQP